MKKILNENSIGKVYELYILACQTTTKKDFPLEEYVKIVDYTATESFFIAVDCDKNGDIDERNIYSLFNVYGLCLTEEGYGLLEVE